MTEQPRKPATRLLRLFRTSVFQLTLVYMALFAASVGALSAFVYWSTLGFLERQTNAVIEAEIDGLYEQYERRGLAGLADIIEERPAGEELDDFDPEGPADDGNPFGEPEANLTHAVDVRPWVDRKRRSIACHASQVSDSSFFLQMPDEVFTEAFGTEWFIERGAEPGLRPGWLFE